MTLGLLRVGESVKWFTDRNDFGVAGNEVGTGDMSCPLVVNAFDLQRKLHGTFRAKLVTLAVLCQHKQQISVVFMFNNK
jgi:hypothetical protein